MAGPVQHRQELPPAVLPLTVQCGIHVHHGEPCVVRHAFFGTSPQLIAWAERTRRCCIVVRRECDVNRSEPSLAQTHACRSCIADVQVVSAGEDIVYTYDVYWREVDIEWPQRWDAYLRPSAYDADLQRFSVQSSLMMTAMLSVIAVVVVMRTMRRDLAHHKVLRRVVYVGKVCAMAAAAARGVLVQDRVILVYLTTAGAAAHVA